jgi:hypothetical protein
MFGVFHFGISKRFSYKKEQLQKDVLTTLFSRFAVKAPSLKKV